MTLAPGTRIRRYEVSDLLGAGGMGEVYLARDVELGRPVALKVLPSTEDEHVHRFLQEAKAAISLSHPNVAHIYDAGDENGVRFLAMEYVQGETLRARIARGTLPLHEALEIMQQVASALASAHTAGIVHRDVKPENVMLRPDGYVKVLDFGLAKLMVREADHDSATQIVHTAPGMVMGTMHYMSPEQLRGAEVDPRADVFSLGVMLYELVSGHRPFQASTPSGVIAAILTEKAQPIEGVAPELAEVIAKSLAKEPDERYASAREMAEALKRIRGETLRIKSGDIPTQMVTQLVATPSRRPWRAILIAAGAIVLLAIGGWLAARQRRIAQARASIPKIQELADARQYFEAWDLAKSVRPIVGSDERLSRALQKITDELTVKSTPDGAQVFVQRLGRDGSLGPRQLAGTTPLQRYAIPHGDHLVTVDKEGFASVERPINTTPIAVQADLLIPQPPPVLDVKLMKSGEAPDRMALVAGGPYKLTGWMFTRSPAVDLDPFFIDKYEVTNRDFEQFVRDGGYRRRELWKEPIVRDGKTLSFEEAMALFRDTTGLPGPRSWAQGKYPQGLETYPVTNITWYEAAAYAEHAGKKLPTIFQWDKAARNGVRSPFGNVYPWGVSADGRDVTQRANFRGNGPMPVDSLPAGMSAWGAYHLAGNVSEWLRNRHDAGYATAGGAFDDPVYQFGYIGAYPGSFSGPKIGFRCVRELTGGGRDQGALALTSQAAKPVAYKAIGDAEFARVRRVYDYARTPLDASVVARAETSDWVRERITFTGGGGKTAIAYLYLPKGAKPPYQVVHFVPPGDVFHGLRPLSQSTEGILAGVIRGGRAVFAVVLEGFIERQRPSGAPVDQHAILIDSVTDLRRGLDYLASRGDVDMTRLGFFGPSAGSYLGMIVTAVDDRYRAVIIMGAGMDPPNDREPAEVQTVNFVPRIAAPKLMLHGKYDEANPWTAEAEPIYRLMRPPKEVSMFDGGHIPPLEWMTPRLIGWLDKQFGAVAQ